MQYTPIGIFFGVIFIVVIIFLMIKLNRDVRKGYSELPEKVFSNSIAIGVLIVALIPCIGPWAVLVYISTIITTVIIVLWEKS